MPIKVAPKDAPVVKPGYQHESEQHKNRCGLRQIAQRHQRGRMVNDDLGFLERDDSQKKPDACRYGQLQILRN
jgi:hypothetical protein